VTIYHDEVVIQALVNQGVSLPAARGYAHCACHNVVVVGQEAGTGVGGFHNVPRLILRALNAGRESETFEQFWSVLQAQVRSHLADARQSWERRWREEFEPACPLLPSALLPDRLAPQKPCWQAAPVSHFNHYLLGLGTAVDSLLAIRRLVFEEQRLSLPDLVRILDSDWSGQEPLRQQIRTRFPRYGQDCPEAREMAAELGRMWVAEVERAARGMARLQMWPGFYSHMVHVPEGERTPATPDGRRSGEPLSENVAPSYGTPGCSPTSILKAMAALPFDHTPSGAATLTLSASDLSGEEGTECLLALLESYFRLGGLHLQVNVLDGKTLEEARQNPERYPDLMVRVTGFSAYFTRLSRNVQEDLVRRYRRDGPGA
jgi:formate C-acetyltransferase